MSTLEVATTPPVRRRPGVGWTELGVAVLGYLLLFVAATMVLGATGRPAGAVLVTAVSGFVTLGAVGLALAVRVRSTAPLRLRRPGRRWLVIGLAAAVGLRLVTMGVVVAWMHLTGDTTHPQQFLLDGAIGGGWALAGMVAFGGLLVPLAEELFFRGVVYGALRRYGPLVGVLGSSALFALAHGLSVVLVAAFLLGVVNSVLVERSGSIWPAVIVHATNNTLAFVLAALLL